MCAGQVRLDATIKAVFDRFDVNRSGRLDYRELRTCLRALGLDVTSREAAEVLLAYDADANGLMELLEFARLVRRLGYRPQPHAQQPGPPLLGAAAGCAAGAEAAASPSRVAHALAAAASHGAEGEQPSRVSSALAAAVDTAHQINASVLKPSPNPNPNPSPDPEPKPEQATSSTRSR